ncbi:unnamed protein product [Dovyalis caffra]|uniref:Uncharacterized protein n=1 Tax=Dovyalis caffra TaxID=77055 RepID=A0AAV1QTU7_9ROSI|nr:unnamed protein product [Dovyalis caffra]
MRTSKISSGNSGYHVWILSFAMILLLLIALSKSWIHDTPSVTASENVQFSGIVPSKGKDHPPVLAYWICGTRGDGKRMFRLLKAIYHPRNQYLLQLDAEASDYERADLVVSIQSESLFQAFGNVNVVGKGYAINEMGSSALAAILNAAALLLRLSPDWDWFINLSASDYPLVSQDDLLHAFASLPRDLNFINYTNDSARIEVIPVSENLSPTRKPCLLQPQCSAATAIPSFIESATMENLKFYQKGFFQARMKGGSGSEGAGGLGSTVDLESLCFKCRFGLKASAGAGMQEIGDEGMFSCSSVDVAKAKEQEATVVEVMTGLTADGAVDSAGDCRSSTGRDLHDE